MDDERPRGILTEADRKYLRDPDEYSRQAAHERKKHIEERLHNAIIDFSILFDTQEFGDWEQFVGEAKANHPAAIEAGLRDMLAFVFLNTDMIAAAEGRDVNQVLGGQLLRDAVEQTMHKYARRVTHYSFEVEGERIPFEDIVQKIEAGETLDADELGQFFITCEQAEGYDIEPLQEVIRVYLQAAEGGGEPDQDELGALFSELIEDTADE